MKVIFTAGFPSAMLAAQFSETSSLMKDKDYHVIIYSDPENKNFNFRLYNMKEENPFFVKAKKYGRI